MWGAAGPSAGERERQPQIRKAIAASASSAAPMFFSLSRHSSPVSRRRRRFGASSTASRAAGPGAESGATLIDLRRFNGGSEFAWTADGGLALDCVNAVRVVVAPDGLSWSTEADGGAAQPIAEAEARLAVLLAPGRRRHRLTGEEGRERLKNIGAALLALAAIAFLIWG